jgi:hypothetical protein
VCPHGISRDVYIYGTLAWTLKKKKKKFEKGDALIQTDPVEEKGMNYSRTKYAANCIFMINIKNPKHQEIWNIPKSCQIEYAV